MWGLKFLALLALGAPLFADLFEFALAAIDAEVGEPAVDLDLFFAHAACRAAALTAAGSALAIEVAPHPRKSRQRVLHAGELNLQAGFFGLRAFGEDIENHLLAIDHAEVGEFFPLALLRRREAVVDDDHIAIMRAGEAHDFIRLAGAAEQLFMHVATAGEHRIDDLDAQRLDQLAQLFEQRLRLIHFPRVETKTHQQRAFDHFRFLPDLKHPWEG